VCAATCRFVDDPQPDSSVDRSRGADACVRARRVPNDDDDDDGSIDRSIDRSTSGVYARARNPSVDARATTTMHASSRAPTASSIILGIHHIEQNLSFLEEDRPAPPPFSPS